MGWKLVAEEYVWNTYNEIPDERDREEARMILRSLVDDFAPPDAKPNIWEDHLGNPWAGYSIDLSSGRGFIPYAPIEWDEPDEHQGEELIRVWPIVWGDF